MGFGVREAPGGTRAALDGRSLITHPIHENTVSRSLYILVCCAALIGRRDGSGRLEEVQGWEALASPDQATVHAMDGEAGVGLLAGTGGGLYVSEDFGASWGLRSPVDWNVLSVLITSRGTILVGTYRKGIKRSIDGGENWTSVGFDGNVYVDALLEDPEGSILAAVAGSVADEPTGVFRSNDYGLTWRAIGPIDEHVYSVSVPVPGQIYAGTERGTFRSSDGGETWSRLEDLSASAPLSSVVEVGGVLVAGFAEPRHRAPGAGARRSLDGGITWQGMNGLPPETSVHTLVAVGDTVYASTGDVLGRGGAGIYRTTDRRTWILEGLGGQWPSPLMIAPNGVLFAGATETGVFASVPGSGIWRPLSSGLKNWNPTALASDTAGAVFALTSRSLFRYDETSRNWSETALPEAAAAATPFNFGVLEDRTLVLPAAGGILFTEGVSGPRVLREVPGVTGAPFSVQLSGPDRVIATFPGEGTFETADKGITWEQMEVPPGTRGVFADLGGAVLAFGNGLHRSSGNGWEDVGPSQATIFAVLKCGPELYIGSAPDGVLSSRDEGRSWTPLMEQLRRHTQQPGYVAVHSILCLPDQRPLVSTFSDGVLELAENGTWINVSSGLPTRSVGDLALAPDGTVYVVTTAGVYRSRAWARPGS